ncbi:MAG: thermonuclease family protein [bacterium]
MRINDGDTFEADLDGDGKLIFPRERVRLLFVDTPELTETWKGMDRKHGLPATEFLRQALTQPPIFLLIPKNRATGKYGRTLAVVYAGGRNVNLELIRAGHSPFDTRFRFPADYDRYARAEGEAFDAGRGIWRLPASRRRYLKRLRRELKTPAGRRNPSFSAKVYQASSFNPRGLLDRYVTLEGRVKKVRRIFKQDRLSLLLLQLERGGRKRFFTAVIYRRTAEKLRAESWDAEFRLRLEGFIETYRGRPQRVVHYGRRID